MKKLCLFILCLCLFGCGQKVEPESKTDALYKEYVSYYKKCMKYNSPQQSCEDFAITLVTNITNNDNVRYDVIIDKPTDELTQFKAIAAVEDEKDYNPSSIGLLEEESFTLSSSSLPEENRYKGINLSGMTHQKTFRVRIYTTYTKDNKFVERYLILDGHAS